MKKTLSKKIAAKAQQFGIPEKLALTVAQLSSGIDASISKVRIGVFQIQPSVATALGINPFSVDENIEGGVRFLKSLVNLYGGRYDLILAAYRLGGAKHLEDLVQGDPLEVSEELFRSSLSEWELAGFVNRGLKLLEEGKE